MCKRYENHVAKKVTKLSEARRRRVQRDRTHPGEAYLPQF